MTFLNISIFVIAALCVFIALKAILGPSIWDRLLCLSMLSAKIIMSICLIAAIFEKTYYLDIAMVFAILGFIGNVYFSRYIKKVPDDE